MASFVLFLYFTRSLGDQYDPQRMLQGVFWKLQKRNSSGIVHASNNEQRTKCPFVLHVEATNKVYFCTETLITKR